MTVGARESRGSGCRNGGGAVTNRAARGGSRVGSRKPRCVWKILHAEWEPPRARLGVWGWGHLGQVGTLVSRSGPEVLVERLEGVGLESVGGGARGNPPA